MDGMGSGSRSSNSIGGGVNKRKKGRRAGERCEIVGWGMVNHEREQTGQIAVMRRQDDGQIDGEILCLPRSRSIPFHPFFTSRLE